MNTGSDHLSIERGSHAENEKDEMGGLLAAGLVLASSLIAAPPAAYAGDVPTPELKKTYLLDEIDDAEPSGFLGASQSGRYVVFAPGDTWGSGYQPQYGVVLDTKDGSTFHVPMNIDQDAYAGSFCFSADEKTMIGVDSYGRTDNDPDRATVNVVDLGSKKTKQYELSSDCFVYSNNKESRVQVSKDESLLYLSSVFQDSSDDSDTASYTAHFCVYDYKNGKVSSQRQFTSTGDSEFKDAWMSTDGKYGYVIEEEREKEDDDYIWYVVTVDIGSGKTIAKEKAKGLETGRYNSVPDGSAEDVVINDDGAMIDHGFFVTKKGKVVRTGNKKESNSISYNRDGSLSLVASSDKKSDASKGKYSSLAVVDSKTGKEMSRSDAGLSFVPNEYESGQMTSDGAYVAACVSAKNGGKTLRLIDTKTGVYSKTKIQGYQCYESYSVSSYGAYIFFSPDNSKIYVVSTDSDEERANRVDVYDSNISGASAAAAGSVTSGGSGSGISPVAIVAGVAVVAVVAAGGFFVVRSRKGPKAAAPSAADAPAPAAPRPAAPRAGGPQRAQPQPQQDSAQPDTPRFCGSCGKPLAPGTQFCPHCGAPVKR